MHLDFIVGRVPTNGWAAAGKRRPPPLTLSTPPSLSFVFLLPLAHTHELKPPDRKYRLGSQRGFLIQTSPVEQPEVAAPTPLSFILALSLSLSGSVGFNQLPPHVLATRAYIKTHTAHTHVADSTQTHTHHLLVQSRRAKSFWAAHQSSLWSRTLPERGGV